MIQKSINSTINY